MISNGKNEHKEIYSNIPTGLGVGDLADIQNIIDNVNTDIMTPNPNQDPKNTENTENTDDTDDIKSIGKRQIYNSDYAPRYKNQKKTNLSTSNAADVYEDLLVDNRDNSDKTHKHHNKWLPIQCNNLNAGIRNLKSIVMVFTFLFLTATLSYKYFTSQEIDPTTQELFMKIIQAMGGGLGYLLKKTILQIYI